LFHRHDQRGIGFHLAQGLAEYPVCRVDRIHAFLIQFAHACQVVAVAGGFQFDTLRHVAPFQRLFHRRVGGFHVMLDVIGLHRVLQVGEFIGAQVFAQPVGQHLRCPGDAQHIDRHAINQAGAARRQTDRVECVVGADAEMPAQRLVRIIAGLFADLFQKAARRQRLQIVFEFFLDLGFQVNIARFQVVDAFGFGRLVDLLVGFARLGMHRLQLLFRLQQLHRLLGVDQFYLGVFRHRVAHILQFFGELLRLFLTLFLAARLGFAFALNCLLFFLDRLLGRAALLRFGLEVGSESSASHRAHRVQVLRRDHFVIGRLQWHFAVERFFARIGIGQQALALQIHRFRRLLQPFLVMFLECLFLRGIGQIQRRRRVELMALPAHRFRHRLDVLALGSGDLRLHVVACLLLRLVDAEFLVALGLFLLRCRLRLAILGGFLAVVLDALDVFQLQVIELAARAADDVIDATVRG